MAEERMFLRHFWVGHIKSSLVKGHFLDCHARACSTQFECTKAYIPKPSSVKQLIFNSTSLASFVLAFRMAQVSRI